MSEPRIRASAVAIDAEGALWIGDADGRALWLRRDDTTRAVDPGHADAEPVALALGDDTVFFADRAADLLRRVDVTTGVATAIAAVPGVVGVAVDHGEGALYVVCRDAPTVRQVDLGTGVVTPIADVDGAAAVALAPDRRRLYLVAGPQVVAIELAEPNPAAVAVVDGAELSAVAMTPAGVVVADRNLGRVLGVNLRHGTTAVLATGLDAPRSLAWARARRAHIVADGAGRLWEVDLGGTGARPHHV